MTTVTLLRDLRQFPVADTSVPYAGTLLEGTYPVNAVKLQGTDEYVKIETWICSRSNGVTYAVLNAPSEPITEGISEQSLTDTLARFRGYVYSRNEPRYTSQIPNVIVKIEPPKQDNCCTFVEDLVVHAFELEWEFAWDLHRHEQLMIADWNDIWSPPYGVSEAGLALPVTPSDASSALPEPWTVCQGWGTSSGHTFIIVASHAPTRKVLMLESSSAYGFSGPGFRGLGDLDNYLTSGPPANWFEYPNVPTWEDVHKLYSTGIATAQLKVLTSTLVWGK